MHNLNKEIRSLLDQIVENLCIKIIADEFYRNEMLQETTSESIPENSVFEVSNDNKIALNETLPLCNDFATEANAFSTQMSASNINYDLKEKTLDETIEESINKYEMSFMEMVKDAFVQTTHFPVVTFDKHCQCNLIEMKESTSVLQEDPAEKKRKLNDIEAKYSDGHGTVFLLKANSQIRVGLSKRTKLRSQIYC